MPKVADIFLELGKNTFFGDADPLLPIKIMSIASFNARTSNINPEQDESCVKLINIHGGKRSIK